MPLTPGQSYTGVMILKEYFGLKGDQSLIQFAAEVKQLDEKSKTELVNAAAKELGVTVKA